MLDLFAEPVYQFTFKDSHLVSTCIGSFCSLIFVVLLCFILGGKFMDYFDDHHSTFTVTEAIDLDYYPKDEGFNEHFIAVGL